MKGEVPVLVLVAIVIMYHHTSALITSVRCKKCQKRYYKITT